MKRLKKQLPLLLISSLLMLTVGVTTAIEIKPHTQNGVTYVTGGVGQGQRQAIQQLRKDYNLVLTFALKKTGKYVASVKVDIQDTAGNKILEAVSSGPLMYAKLSPGKYRVIAALNGQAISKPVTIIKNDAKSMYFYWEHE